MNRKCRNCHVTVLDYTMVCPLCHSVLETEGKDPFEGKEFVPGMYPDVKDVTRTLNFIVKLYMFLAIIAQASLMVINYVTYKGLWWSAISGIGILYFYLTLKYSIQKSSGYLRTAVTQIIAAALVTVAIDFILGYMGWSVNFVLPGAILLIDLTVIIVMVINKSSWQSYILLQILTVIFSIIMLVFWKVGIIIYPVVTIVAAAVSAVMFIGTIIFGDRRAKNELIRRFHV